MICFPCFFRGFFIMVLLEGDYTFPKIEKMKKILFLLALAWLGTASGQSNNFVKENYDKIDTTITMRDGVKLYTIIYIPKDRLEKYPFLIQRTPYSVAPYGSGNYAGRVGPNEALMHEKYIFVYQDVRGRYMSEGYNKEVTPYIPDKKTNKDVDESSDTYDTMEWLLKHIPDNNGRAGLYGISYPGFYATASLPAAHPSIRAVSPQAPVTDEFIGDDANHNGAFFLMDNFDFMNFFGKERSGPVKSYGSPIFEAPRTDAYKFFLELGPVKNTQSEKYFNNRSYIWNEYLEHDMYDNYWQQRNIRSHLKNITVPTLVVGGWFDAEDLFGALHTFDAIEKQGSGINNYLVMGPWTHGAWARDGWTRFATYDFESNTSRYFQDSLQTTFFNYFLKDKGSWNTTKATMFETGGNRWHHFDKWPPRNIREVTYYLGAGRKLSERKSSDLRAFDKYISDPANPVPYTGKVQARRNNEYMAEDQSFVMGRGDVLSYEAPLLTENLTVAGPISANLFVSTTGTDADFIVKLIDVVPGADGAADIRRLVRAEVMRGKFRNNYVVPEAFVPGKVSEVKIHLNDVLHTFMKGHRVMVQIQSSWFPLVDRNPQKFMRIPEADESDFQKAEISVYRDRAYSSSIILSVMK